MSSLMIMQAAVSSVNWALNVKPSLPKKFLDFPRSLTGRLTKILLLMCSPWEFVFTPLQPYVEREKGKSTRTAKCRRVARRKYRSISCWVLNILAEVLKRLPLKEDCGYASTSDSRSACLACCHDRVGTRLHDRRPSPSLCPVGDGDARDPVDTWQDQRSMDAVLRRISAARCRSRSRRARHNSPDRLC